MKIRHKVYLLKERFKNDFLIPVCRNSSFLSDLYYFMFSNEFSREHRKVLNGKYLHMQALKKSQPNAFHLRRQIHRLEKGLIMKDRRKVFALDYILDTVRNYKIISEGMEKQSIPKDVGLLRWASAVIQNYFSSVDDHAVISKAKELFFGTPHQCDIPNDHIPYVKRSIKQTSVTFDGLFSLALQRRSVRWYLNKPVDRSLIEQAVSIASMSPSACNRQPFEFRIFDAEEVKNKVGSVPMGIRPFYQQIPVFVVLVGKLSAYLSERDRHVIYIDGGLAAMSFMLALETLGLSSVPINWPDIERYERKMEKLIGLADDERPIMLIGVGHGDLDSMIPFSQKKSSQVLIKYN